MSKVSEEIKEQIRNSKLPYEALAEIYDLSVNQIKYIKKIQKL